VVFWGFISATLGAAGTIFAMNEGAIRHTNLFFRVYYLRHMLRSTLTLAHTLLIFPFVSILFGLPLTVYGLLVIPGLLIVGSFLWATSVSLAYISTRFRDFSPMIVSFMTILFYLTPVVWLPDQLHSNWRLILVDYNPLAQLLEILRAPLLGLLPSWHSVWYSLASTAIVGLLAILLGKKYSSRVAYWL
jgi:lipopolysaccharide transport system permease protein